MSLGLPLRRCCGGPGQPAAQARDQAEGATLVRIALVTNVFVGYRWPRGSGRGAGASGDAPGRGGRGGLHGHRRHLALSQRRADRTDQLHVRAERRAHRPGRQACVAGRGVVCLPRQGLPHHLGRPAGPGPGGRRHARPALPGDPDETRSPRGCEDAAGRRPARGADATFRQGDRRRGGAAAAARCVPSPAGPARHPKPHPRARAAGAARDRLPPAAERPGWPSAPDRLGRHPGAPHRARSSG